jgi:hypothetical protein
MKKEKLIHSLIFFDQFLFFRLAKNFAWRKWAKKGDERLHFLKEQEKE